MWSSWWNEKPKYSEKTFPISTLPTTDSTKPWDRTRAAAVGSRLLTAWTMARPKVGNGSGSFSSYFLLSFSHWPITFKPVGFPSKFSYEWPRHMINFISTCHAAKEYEVKQPLPSQVYPICISFPSFVQASYLNREYNAVLKRSWQFT
jgi:hypothetical protein